MQQAEFVTENVHKLVWTDWEKPLKVGNICFFKGDDRAWYVKKVCDTKKREDINRSWKVEGLF